MVFLWFFYSFLSSFGGSHGSQGLRTEAEQVTSSWATGVGAWTLRRFPGFPQTLRELIWDNIYIYTIYIYIELSVCVWDGYDGYFEDISIMKNISFPLSTGQQLSAEPSATASVCIFLLSRGNLGANGCHRFNRPRGFVWKCCVHLCTSKPNGFADHYPYEKWLFHWEYTLFSDKPTLRRWDATAYVARKRWIRWDFVAARSFSTTAVWVMTLAIAFCQ